MPELPEVETVKRGLEKQITGKKIKSVFTSDKKLRVPFPKNLEASLKNASITAINRRAKYLLIDLDNGKSLIIHLGMSGKILFREKPYTPQKHDHFILEFTDNSILVFNDARRFGLVTLEKTNNLQNNKLLANAGVEPFTKEFNEKYLKTKFENKTQNIKQAIMDATIISGVGNIYASEILFLSKIDPQARAGELNSPKLKLIIKNTNHVLQEAIKSGGSTLRDYVRSDGGLGYFQHQHKVYDRENQPCFTCGTNIKRITQQGRSTFFCPECQKP